MKSERLATKAGPTTLLDISAYENTYADFPYLTTTFCRSPSGIPKPATKPDLSYNIDGAVAIGSLRSPTMGTSASDGIINTIHQFIRNERVRSFSFLAKHSHRFMHQSELLVVSHATQDEVQAMLRRNHKYRLDAFAEDDWYTFNEPRRMNSPSYTIVIMAACDADISIGNLTMTITQPNDQPRTLPAATWLRETYDWDDEWVMKFSKGQYEQQQLWWESTGQSFRLFDLPLELREVLYLQIIGPVVLPDSYNSRLVLGQGLSYGDPKRPGRNCDPDIEPPNMTIMRVSKKVRDEASLVAHRDTFKRLRQVNAAKAYDQIRQPQFTIPIILNRIRVDAPDPAFLRNVQLEMSAASYFACIGLWPRAGHPFAIDNNPSGFRLSKLGAFPALQRLDFRFISPKHPGAICPWATVIGTAKDGDHSCQTMWIHWFFALAWNTLQTLNRSGRLRFSLSGCVKTAVQKLWEHMLNDGRGDHTPFIRTKEAEIRATKTDDGPIPCKCSTPCSRKAAEEGKTHTFSETEIKRIEGLQQHIDDMYWRYED